MNRKRKHFMYLFVSNYTSQPLLENDLPTRWQYIAKKDGLPQEIRCVTKLPNYSDFFLQVAFKRKEETLIKVKLNYFLQFIFNASSSREDLNHHLFHLRELFAHHH